MNKFIAWCFELNKYRQIHNLIPIKKEFLLENVEAIIDTEYIVCIKPVWSLYKILVHNEKDRYCESLWIDKGTAKIVIKYLKPNHELSNKRAFIESLSAFLNHEYATGKEFMFQDLDGKKQKIFWEDDLEILDFYSYQKRNLQRHVYR